MKEFEVSKFSTYYGPNFYLDRRAVVFNVHISPGGNPVNYYQPDIVQKFPELEGKEFERVIDLYATVLVRALKMRIDLFINKFEISRDAEEFVVAVEFLDEGVTYDVIELISNWFTALEEKDYYFNFEKEYRKLQTAFDKTMFGGPTIYSLVEAGLKRNIPVNYLYEENQFQWGYGKKQWRGRSTIFQTDGIKDTEFTMYKDMVKDFLVLCGFPTPIGRNCMKEEEVVKQAATLGYPVVVKPLAGHKGQGVTTGISNEAEVRKAFKVTTDLAEEQGKAFEGAIVEQQIYGTDHRLLAVGGKFVAALERVAAFVLGNGVDTIEKLIAVENERPERLGDTRSPLDKIKIDDDILDFLKLQELTLQSVPEENKRVELRRVANISAGGVSINVTDKIHPLNKKLVGDIAKFFNITVMGIDVLCKDISKPWTEGNFGIIEINAGPGVFMHLAPAFGGSIDVPSKIVEARFPVKGSDRIPIIAGNCLKLAMVNDIYKKINKMKPDIEYGSVTDEGVYFNGEYFYKNPIHFENVKIILRNPLLGFAVFNHRKDDIFDYGAYHEGADLIVLENPHYAYEMLERDLLDGGYKILIDDQNINLYKKGNDKPIKSSTFDDLKSKDKQIVAMIEEVLPDLVERYE